MEGEGGRGVKRTNVFPKGLGIYFLSILLTTHCNITKFKVYVYRSYCASNLNPIRKCLNYFLLMKKKHYFSETGWHPLPPPSPHLPLSEIVFIAPFSCCLFPPLSWKCSKMSGNLRVCPLPQSTVHALNTPTTCHALSLPQTGTRGQPPNGFDTIWCRICCYSLHH